MLCKQTRWCFRQFSQKQRQTVLIICWRTKSGQQFVFETITVIDSEWIHLNPFESDDPSIRMPGFFAGPLKPDAYVVHERGIDIRLDSIAWVADGKS